MPQLANAVVGPYRVSVWTQPEPLRVGTMHISVAVSEPPEAGREGEVGAPVLDATVRVRLEPLRGEGGAITVFATHEAAVNKILYETDLELPSEGQWRVEVFVDGPAGSGSGAFDVRVLPPSRLNWALVGGAGLLLLTLYWLVWGAKMPRYGSVGRET